MTISSCNFCENGHYKLLFKAGDYITGDQFGLYECLKCLLVQTFPKPDKKIMYSQYYQNYRKSRGERFPNIVEQVLNFCYFLRVKKILKLHKTGRILDVGCGRGVELRFLKKRGWQVLGTEISTDLITQLLQQNISVINTNIWEIKNKRKFDLISFWHSLEHLYYPSKALKAAFELLNDKGYLIIAVPNFGSLESKFFGKFWFHLDVPRHLFHFSKQSLVNFAKKMGFKLEKQVGFSPEYDFYSFFQSSLNFLFPNSTNLIYLLLLGEKLSIRQRSFVIIQIPFAVLVLLLSIIAVALLVMLGQTGTMVLLFRKDIPEN